MIRQRILCSLIDTLDKEHITWGVGGSFLLSLHNLYDNPNDIDLWVELADLNKLKSLFHDFEELDNDIPMSDGYRFRIMYYDIEVDFVACFKTKPNQHIFKFLINPDNLQIVEHNGMSIPCTYLEDWYIIYRLIGKDDKAEIIKNVFESQRIQINYVAIEEAIYNKQITLPLRIKDDVWNLIKISTQLSIPFDTDSGIISKME